MQYNPIRSSSFLFPTAQLMVAPPERRENHVPSDGAVSTLLLCLCIEMKTTAWFIEKVSKWFDLMSSRYATLALSKLNPTVYQETISFLQEMMVLFKELEVVQKDGQKRWKPFQTGALLSTASTAEVEQRPQESLGPSSIAPSSGAHHQGAPSPGAPSLGASSSGAPSLGASSSGAPSPAAAEKAKQKTPQEKRKKMTNEVKEAKSQMATFASLNDVLSKKEPEDCDLDGQLLALKLRQYPIARAAYHHARNRLYYSINHPPPHSLLILCIKIHDSLHLQLLPFPLQHLLSV
ncbi:hypothetical protein JTE90_024690 [Oedothorax gibbosus]|uniref:Uncharacterized protein n=1 Tax=Oedothorax gibbosus TaxID=931172 RepID=A0AAV6UA91_9ARAC|nr:hypothetical protein JTE90_024690 [Oedothorax gibbosus]